MNELVIELRTVACKIGNASKYKKIAGILPVLVFTVVFGLCKWRLVMMNIPHKLLLETCVSVLMTYIIRMISISYFLMTAAYRRGNEGNDADRLVVSWGYIEILAAISTLTLIILGAKSYGTLLIKISSAGFLDIDTQFRHAIQAR